MEKNAVIRFCLDEGKKTCRGGGNQPSGVYRYCVQEIFTFLLLIFKGDFSSLRTWPFFPLSALKWLVAADNTETISTGWALMLSTSTNAHKFTHTHTDQIVGMKFSLSQHYVSIS